MEAKAVVMGLLGFSLLYGGLAACIAIAWYHGQHRERDGGSDEAGAA